MGFSDELQQFKKFNKGYVIYREEDCFAAILFFIFLEKWNSHSKEWNFKKICSFDQKNDRKNQYQSKKGQL